jgi:hypothetical protein
LLSPADLLEQAEEFSSRIPAGDEYEEDRNSSWLAIGQAWLRLQDGHSAMRALGHLDHARCQAVLAHAIAVWTGDHPEFEAGRELLNRISDYAAELTPRELSDLVLPLFRIYGQGAVIAFAEAIGDSFSAAKVLVMLSYFLVESESRRQVLESAEQFAGHTMALLSVYRAYRTAGFETDAQRVSALLPDLSDQQILDAEKILEGAERIVALHARSPIEDTPMERLTRFLQYKFNDLKVRFLVDSAIAGGMADPAVEDSVVGEAFAAIEPPRAASIFRDPTGLEDDAFAGFFFERPVVLEEIDRELLEGSDYFREPWPDADIVQPRAVALFRNFAEVARRYSHDQIDQGLWLMLGGRLFQPEFDDAMFTPFHDYYAQHGDQYDGSAFFMWWDQIRAGERALPVLEKILALPSAACQRAALHGLNHMRPDPRASEVVTRYIEENHERLTPEELEYAEECRDGRAL